MRDVLSRRNFIRKTATAGAVGLGAAALLSACGKKEGGDTKAAAGCNDVSGLNAADKGMRTSNAYVDKAADPKKACDLCQLYKAPAAGAACGGCTVIKGPIAPKGTCNLWAAKSA